MAETKKILVMRENPELFKKYLDAVDRNKYLMCTICLCDDVIELYVFKTDRTGIDFVQTFEEYDSETLQEINTILDRQAAKLKEQWARHYKQLSNSAGGGEGWALDLSQSDYAVLIVGVSLLHAKYYRLKWSFEGLQDTARFIADAANPSSEALEEMQRQHAVLKIRED